MEIFKAAADGDHTFHRDPAYPIREFWNEGRPSRDEAGH
jgi:hypothetical protein